jgi:phosphoenolpyruvate-protein phosphotransferase (PTS system enzyme I)
MTDRHPATGEIVLRGISASPGTAVGKAYHFAQIDLKALEDNKMPVDDVKSEIARFRNAVDKSIEQLNGLRESSKNEGLREITEIFQVHIQLLSDADFVKTVPALISQTKLNTEYILANQIRDLEKRFATLGSEIARAKLLDVQDVYFRLLRNVLDIEHVRALPLRRMPSPVILVAEGLLPSDIALLDLKKIIGIAIENGSTVSHVSIIARALSIPFVINARGVASLSHHGSVLILDACDGNLILRPQPDTVARYEKKAQKECALRPASRHAALPCFTKDGIKIRLEANAGSAPEVRESLEQGAEGIGLLRSELFYLSREALPSIDEETAFYESVMSLCGQRPLTIRLLDIGADKTLPYLNMVREENPHLGVRGIRFLQRHPALMRSHLTSVVRACRTRGAKLLLPFVSIPREVVETRRIILDICKKEGVDPESCPVGIMLEIPAVVLSLADFITTVDFLSVGTNDLVQYVFAACRENSSLEEYRAASFPLLLKLIKSVIEAAAIARKEVTVCGEIAADPVSAACLVGAGVRALSMNSPAVRTVCQELCKKTIRECIAMAERNKLISF